MPSPPVSFFLIQVSRKWSVGLCWQWRWRRAFSMVTRFIPLALAVGGMLHTMSGIPGWCLWCSCFMRWMASSHFNRHWPSLSASRASLVPRCTTAMSASLEITLCTFGAMSLAAGLRGCTRQWCPAILIAYAVRFLSYSRHRLQWLTVSCLAHRSPFEQQELMSLGCKCCGHSLGCCSGCYYCQEEEAIHVHRTRHLTGVHAHQVSWWQVSCYQCW